MEVMFSATHSKRYRAIIIAPNPIKAGETFCVKVPNCTSNESMVEVYNSDGNCVIKREATSNFIEFETINTPGIYFVRMTNIDGNAYNGKLIVK